MPAAAIPAIASTANTRRSSFMARSYGGLPVDRRRASYGGLVRVTVGCVRAVLPAVVLLAVGCGDESGPVAAIPVSAPVSPMLGTAAATPEDAGSERCEALAAFAAAAPPAGLSTMTPEEWRAAYHDYADAADAAARLVKPAEAAALGEIGETLRLIGDDPTSPELADTVASLSAATLELAEAAERDCGVRFDGPSG